MVVFFSQEAQPLEDAGQENKLLPAGNIAADDTPIDDSVAVNKNEFAYLRTPQKLLSEPGDETPPSFVVPQDADVEYVALNPMPSTTAKSKALAGICKLKSAAEWVNKAAVPPIHASKTERR